MDQKTKKIVIIIGISALALFLACACCGGGIALLGARSAAEEESPTEPLEQSQPLHPRPRLERVEVADTTVKVYLTVYQNTLAKTPTLNGVPCQNEGAVLLSLSYSQDESHIVLEFPVPETPSPWKLDFEGWEISIRS